MFPVLPFLLFLLHIFVLQLGHQGDLRTDNNFFFFFLIAGVEFPYDSFLFFFEPKFCCVNNFKRVMKLYIFDSAAIALKIRNRGK